METTSPDLAAWWQQLLTLLMEPASNLLAAVALYGAITLVLLIAVVVAILFLISSPEDEEDDEGSQFTEDDFYVPEDDEPVPSTDTQDEAAAAPSADSSITGDTVAAATVPGAEHRRARTSRSRLQVLLVYTALVVAVWIATGFTTSADAVCTGCHVDTPHMNAADTTANPHAGVSCVSCHEPGGSFGRYVGDLPGRLTHFADGLAGGGIHKDYGRVTQAACRSCHYSSLSGVVTDEDRGLKMSHSEALDAGMRCLDCHTARGGVVATHNAGMNPCLRCHDATTASADCATCHDKQAAAAARARTTSFSTQQVGEVTCGGCHDEQRECDPCHGIRMPHSRSFMGAAHARAGAVDYWFDASAGCVKCHTATRRPCIRCHNLWPGSGHPRSLASEHVRGSDQSCDTCHKMLASTRSRSFCADVCHTESAMAESPR